MPIKYSVDAIQRGAIKESFESIYKNNLSALSRIPPHVLVNPVTQIQSLDNNICVNYINLNGANEAETRLALETAVLEEYCGIYGISLERQWPFQRFSSPDLLKIEATERLMSCVVFVLNPPTQNKLIYKLPDAEKPTELAFYQVQGEMDGFAQQRDKNILTAKKLPYTNRVTEIKTVHSFSMAEVYAILVPEHLIDVAKMVFKEIEIISVPSRSQVLQSLPNILSKFHDEEINAPLIVTAPDFLNTVLNFTKDRKIQQFSLHAVRLHTTFDFVTRPMMTLSKNEKLIEQLHAKMIKIDSDDDNGWVVVHKNFGLSKEPLFDKLLAKKALPQAHIDKMRLAAKFSNELFRQLVTSKGNVIFNIVYADLSNPQLVMLNQLKVNIVKLSHFYVVSYNPTIKAEVSKIIDNFDSIRNAAAIKLQSTFRGFWARGVVDEFKKSKDSLAHAQEAFNAAEAKVKLLLG